CFLFFCDPCAQADNIQVKRECILKALCVYLNEDPEKLVKEYLDTEDSKIASAETVIGISVILHEGAEPGENVENVSIILEGIEVMSELDNVPFAVAMLLGIIYTMNLNYPQELKYFFEFLQKIFLELDGIKLSHKVQVLKTLLSR
uniref:Uncharacterized protein n=1 Tax=Oryzias melastigma TaxID=30732 RepID=A0A3B3CY52_ORYME